MSNNRYIYSAVRIVPSPAAGEYVNIAVIAGSDETGEWSIRELSNESRIRHFCTAEAIAAAHDTLTNIGFAIDLHTLTIGGVLDEESRVSTVGADEVGEKWLTSLFERSNRVIQFSSPAPVLAPSVESALDIVFPRITIEPERRIVARLTKWRLTSELGKGYIKAGLRTDNFLRSIDLVSQGPHSYSSPLDFAVIGDNAVQLVQSWSFQVAAQSALARDVKAWGWTLMEFKENGGFISTPARPRQVSPEVPIYALVAPPTEDQSSAVYEEALGVFDELGVKVRSYGQELDVARDGAELLAKSGYTLEL